MLAKKPSLAMRLAAVMQMTGIEGLPRNYELVYEAYAGTDPELVKAFKALGKDKTQAALDEVGRRFLPHHFEAGSLEAHTGRVKDEMQAFLEILQEEQSSLAQYNELVGGAIETMASTTLVGNETLAKSMEALTEATRQRQVRAEVMSKQVSQQTAALEAVTHEVASVEQQKFTDALTGLGNRRMFNKELASVFKASSLETFGVAILDVDGFDRFVERKLNTNDLLKVLGSHLKFSAPEGAILCRFDAGKFGIIYHDSSKDDVDRFCRRVNEVLAESKQLRGVTVSTGVCMSSDASDGFDLVTLAEKAVLDAHKAGAGSIVFYENNSSSGRGRNFAIYEAAQHD